MDAAMIDLKDLAKYLRKRRIIILVAALAFALMFNIYGVTGNFAVR